MIRRPPRSTQSRSSAASDVYKRQVEPHARSRWTTEERGCPSHGYLDHHPSHPLKLLRPQAPGPPYNPCPRPGPVSYTHLRAHETDSYLVCRLLLEKKKT